MQKFYSYTLNRTIGCKKKDPHNEDLLLKLIYTDSLPFFLEYG